MKRIPYLFLGFFCAFNMQSVCAESNEPDEASETSIIQSISSLYAKQAYWTFSGMVMNENGERYPYFFQIKRNNERFHALATLLDAQTKSVLLYEESSTLIEHPELTHWQVGNMFLRFNPINNSWVFGVRDKDKRGFNFKIDMFGLSEEQLSKTQDLRSGIKLLITQTGRLNGHMRTESNSNKDEFVTAKRSWFRQTWVSRAQAVKHPLTTIYCDFEDGQALYSVTLPEADSLRGSVAGWRNEQGVPVTMSQFVSIENKENDWSIHVSSPKVGLSFSNLLYKLNEKNQLNIGLTQGTMPGFCAINQEEIDAQTESST